MELFNALCKNRRTNIPISTIETIQRQITILTESANLVNTSNNLDVVIRRINMVSNSIEILQKYSDQEFNAAGYKLKESLKSTANFVQEHKEQLINQAIERNIRSAIDSLHTPNGKMNKLEILYKKFYERKDLSPENVSFLIDLYGSISNDLYDIAESEE